MMKLFGKAHQDFYLSNWIYLLNTINFLKNLT
nr:MAG TPA: hypothetical protein [Caudoviricetes sp.]